MKRTFLFPVINTNKSTVNTIESVLNQTDQNFILKISVNNSYVNKRNWGTKSTKLASRLGYV